MLVKARIRGMNWYLYLKYSWIFRIYERLFKPQVRSALKKEVELYRAIIGHTDLIFDIGAYDGHKTAAFLELCDRVVACEPDPKSFRLLRMRFRSRKGRVTLHPEALSDGIGTGLLYIHHPGSAFNTLNSKWKEILELDRRKRWNEEIRFQAGKTQEVRMTTLDELIRVYGMPGFIKIDVEGYERKVIEGLNRPVPCISFECLLPEFRDDLLFILQKLHSFEGKTVFNVLVEEELVFPEFIAYDRIMEWVDTTRLYAFDMVARFV